jgi:hypothetical protein
MLNWPMDISCEWRGNSRVAILSELRMPRRSSGQSSQLRVQRA